MPATLPARSAVMSLNCGIVGLPNVGKSTIFNALSQTRLAQAANYPFCTIDPNSAMVAVPDGRLAVLADIVHTRRLIPVQIELVDIAGLVKGASTGAGKGNAFLSHIRAVDAILHVVRCFDDDTVIHVDGSVDPVRDMEIIDLELVLKDEETVRHRLERCRKRRDDAALRAEADLLERILAGFAACTPVRQQELTTDERAAIADLQLITAKPMLLVANVGERDLATGGNAHSAAVAARATATGARHLAICGKIEEELAMLAPADRRLFMADLGIDRAGLDTLITAGYDLLGLGTFFTAGEQEVRAWQFVRGWLAPQAAGVIHTDFERLFIRAEVAAYEDFVSLGGERACREAGRLRAEGRDYVVQEGDVMHFLHGA
jgi:hypothetical protein